MILTCPACKTRFSVDGALIGEAGRKVRCAKCGDSWHQMPVEEASPAPAAAAAPAAVEADTAEDEAENGDENEGEAAPADDAESADGAEADAAASAVATARAARRARSSRAADAEQESKRGWVGWLVLLLVLSGIAGGGYVFQAKIVEMWPPSGKLYEMVGLTAEAEKFGLAIQNVTWERAREKGKPVLLVQGEVSNTSEMPQPVPRLRVIIRDDQGRRLFRWTVTTAVSTLEPGKTTKFTTRLANPPDGARSLAVTFLLQP